MLNKSRGRIVLFGEHSDWMVNYSLKNKYVPSHIIGLASSTNIGMNYRAIEKDGNIVTFESANSNGIRSVYFSDRDTRSFKKWTNTSSKLLNIAVSTVYDYIGKKKGIENYEDDESCKGVDIIVISQDLPIKRGLASSTCMVRAIIYELIRVNGVLSITTNYDICNLMQIVELIVNGTNAGSDIIINNAPGLTMVNHALDTKDIQLSDKYESIGGFADKIMYNDGAGDNLVLIDIGAKTVNTDYIISSLSRPFKDDTISEQCIKDIANLFGETTTNYSKIAANIIANATDLHTVYKDLGYLMWEFQKQYTSVIMHNTQYLPSAIADHKANKILQILMDEKLIYGGKVTGSHADSIILASTQYTADFINNKLKANNKLRQKSELNDVKVINI